MSPRLRDAVGVLEISARLGYPQRTVETWRDRGIFPAPAVYLSRTPVWEWSAVLRWARDTGRDDRMGGYPA